MMQAATDLLLAPARLDALPGTHLPDSLPHRTRPGGGPPTMMQAATDLLLDPARLAALRSTDLLDSLPEPSFDRLTRLAAQIPRAPGALVSPGPRPPEAR